MKEFTKVRRLGPRVAQPRAMNLKQPTNHLREKPCFGRLGRPALGGGKCCFTLHTTAAYLPQRSNPMLLGELRPNIGTLRLLQLLDWCIQRNLRSHRYNGPHRKPEHAQAQDNPLGQSGVWSLCGHECMGLLARKPVRRGCQKSGEYQRVTPTMKALSL